MNTQQTILERIEKLIELKSVRFNNYVHRTGEDIPTVGVPVSDLLQLSQELSDREARIKAEAVKECDRLLSYTSAQSHQYEGIIKARQVIKEYANSLTPKRIDQ